MSLTACRCRNKVPKHDATTPARRGSAGTAGTLSSPPPRPSAEYTLRRALREAAAAAVAAQPMAAPASTPTGPATALFSRALVPEPGTGAFSDWAHAFVDAHGGGGGCAVAAAEDELVAALRALSHDSTAGGLAVGDLQPAGAPTLQQRAHRCASKLQFEQRDALRVAFASRACRSTTYAPTVQHLHPPTIMPPVPEPAALPVLMPPPRPPSTLPPPRLI